MGAKGRAGGRLAIARARWLVRRWLAGRRRRRRRRGGEEYMRAAVYGWLAASRFFVSQVVLSCTLGETAGRAVHVAERVGPSSARSAPPRLSLNCRLCPDPARVSARCMPISILPTCSGIGKTLPRVRSQKTGTRSFMSSMPYTLLPSIVHDHSTLANIHADQHMPAEQPPRPSRCLPTSRPPSTSGGNAQAPR